MAASFRLLRRWHWSALLVLLLRIQKDGGLNRMMAEARAQYPDSPTVLWSKSLPDTGSINDEGIRRGNAVRISPDDAVVYVTLSEGTLHMLNPATGDVLNTHTVEPFGEGWSVQCWSEVNFHFSGTRRFAVYGVVDVPPSGSGQVLQSRVIAVNHPTGQIMFTSLPIPGRVAGTPVITSDGSFILVTRNTEDGTVGHFTILSVIEYGKVRYTESSEQFRADDRAPYGAPGIIHNPMRGMFDAGTGNTNDVVLWADSTDFGRADDGLTRAFQFPVDFNGIDFDGVQTVRLRIVGFTTTNEPVFSRDGLNVYFTGTRSAVRGWNRQDFGGPITWKADVTRKKNDGLQPIFSRATLSNDEKRILVGSAGSTFVSLNATGGTILWEELTDSVVLVAPMVSPDDKRVYFIEAYGGNVKSYDVKRGNSKWSVDCSIYLSNPNCYNANVEGSFSISSDGHRIYFGNTLGSVAALGVSYEPTEAPTPVPTTMEPTSIPTPSPSSAVPTSMAPTPAPSTLAPTSKSTPMPTVSLPPTSSSPTFNPTKQPTVEPTLNPIPPPTEKPTLSPTQAPTEELVTPVDGGEETTFSSGPRSLGAARLSAISVVACAAATALSTLL